MHKGQILRFSQRVGVLACRFQRVAMQHHFGTKAARALHFYTGGEARHHDHGAYAHALRVVGHALGMVARAHGDHAARLFFGGQQLQAVAGTALLERGGELQVLKLQKHLCPHDVRQGLGLHAGRAQHMVTQALGGGLDIGIAQHGLHILKQCVRPCSAGAENFFSVL